MGNPELSHQIGQVAHNAKEAGRLLLDSNLFQSLQDIGHPYGLLLSQSKNPSSKQLLTQSSTESNKMGDGWVGLIFNSSNFLFPEPKMETLESSSFAFEQGLADIFFEGNILLQRGKSFLWGSYPSSLLSQGVGELSVVSSNADLDKNGLRRIVPFLFSSSWLSSFLERVDYPKADDLNASLPFIIGPLNFLTKDSFSHERQRHFQVGRSGVSLGTSSIHLKDYKGEQPFTIKTPQGESVTQINPGDPLGSVHVSRQAGFLKELTPLEKVNAVTDDLLALFSAIEETGLTDIPVKAQQTLEKAKSATIIGISHLVRLFRRKTGLHTWGLDILPEAVQNLHQFDSQAVSDRFGGGRKVKPRDIEMLVITPEQRQMLVATA